MNIIKLTDQQLEYLQDVVMQAYALDYAEQKDLDIHAIIKLDTHTPMNTIKVTDAQLEYLQDLVMFAYEMEVPEQKGWDIQTFDNLVDAVCSPTGQPL